MRHIYWIWIWVPPASPQVAYLHLTSLPSRSRWDVRPFVPDESRRCEGAYEGVHHGAEKVLLKCSWSPDGSKVASGSADRSDSRNGATALFPSSLSYTSPLCHYHRPLTQPIHQLTARLLILIQNRSCMGSGLRETALLPPGAQGFRQRCKAASASQYPYVSAAF